MILFLLRTDFASLLLEIVRPMAVVDGHSAISMLECRADRTFDDAHYELAVCLVKCLRNFVASRIVYRDEIGVSRRTD
jgi:hypothetical protein